MIEIESILEKYPFVQRDNLIPILQDIQKAYGYLSEESIVKVGKYLNMPTSKIYGLATFYSQFRFEQKAKFQICICNGSSCHVNANAIIIREFKKSLGIEVGGMTKDGKFSLSESNCLGACGLGPVVRVNHKFHTQVSMSDVKEIIDYYSNRD